MPSTLDTLIARARTSQARDDGHALVAELDRWVAPRPARPRWPVWFGGAALAAAAALVLFLWWPRAASPVPGAPLQLGGRVAIVTAPGTVYRVGETSGEITDIVVERGALTARLWQGAAPHRLVLRGGDVTATATGTVYTLRVDDGAGAVYVHEGAVTVRTHSTETRVAAGASWPPALAPVETRAAEILLAWQRADDEHATPPAEPPQTPGAPPDALDDATTTTIDAPATRTAERPDANDDAAGAPSITERWRQARLMRGQGRFDEALATCVAIGDAHDPTWSPIALLEAARIALDALGDPARAEVLARRVEAEWPGHALVPEARVVACRAATQQGRAADCQ